MNPLSSLEQLEATLRDEVALYDQFRQLMGEKKSLIISGKSQDLEQLLAVDNQLVLLSQSSKTLEAQRQSLMQDLGYAGKPLRQFLDGASETLLDAASKKRMNALREQLRERVLGVRLLNEEHQELLMLSAQWVENTAKVFAKALFENTEQYTATGQALDIAQHLAGQVTTVDRSA